MLIGQIFQTAGDIFTVASFSGLFPPSNRSFFYFTKSLSISIFASQMHFRSAFLTEANFVLRAVYAEHLDIPPVRCILVL